MCHANVNVSLIVKNATQIKSGIMISVVVGVKIQKNSVYERGFFWNPETYSCKNDK